MHLTSRVRWAVARRPWISWLVVGALALGTGLLVADAVGAIDDARRSWGDDRTVLVATRDGRPGDAVATVATRRARPAPMVPDAAVADAEPDAVLRQHVAAGEMLTEPDVAAGPAPRALIPDGYRAVAVAEGVPSGAALGDPVAVASGGIVLAADGVVVGTGDGAVLVAVPADQAAAVAAAPGDVALLLDP